ncbi:MULTISPECIES: hypothetical protein [Colwellia]|uniref:TetR family transcriptional regulator n=1 Tax=Colwellia marinimaniae TaxID=1513592 RepID=A0ABQ0MRY1_9GAMM|nr:MULTISPECIES: hypothetical protein [Colwellia]GAW95108.1 hypothetical protein MTCD1_00707 [Colwellia marinimaniae]
MVLAGEPSDIFWQWRGLLDSKDRNEKDAKTRQLSVIMAQRSDVLIKLIPENKGYSFTELVAGGSRFFSKAKHEMPLQQPRAINAWLQVLASGIMGFVLERKLFKLSNTNFIKLLPTCAG